MIALLFALVIQVTAWVALASLWHRFARLGLVESVVAALLTSHVLALAFMQALSFGHGLTPFNYRMVWTLLSAALLIRSLQAPGPTAFRAARAWLRRCDARVLGVAVLATAAFALAVFRASYFFDTTYDSLTYSLPRLGYYAQHQSIFFLSGSTDLRIDANERNGELVFLHQLLLTGDTRWLNLGGVIAWGTCVTALLFLLRVLQVEAMLACLASLFLALSPIVFGLSGVTKGDAFAAAYVVAAVAWLLQVPRPESIQARAWLFATALCLAVTCKLTAAFGAVGLALLFASDLGRAGARPRVSTALLIALAAGVAFSKAWQNAAVYHHPFQRSQLEQDAAGFSLANLRDGAFDFAGWFFGLRADSLPWGHHNDLEKGFGAVGLVAVAFVLLAFWATRRTPPAVPAENRPAVPEWKVGAILSATGLVLVSWVPVRGVGFAGNALRFLTPYALPAAALLLAWPLRVFTSRPAALAALTLLGGYHLACATNASETLSHRGRRDLAQRLFRYDRFTARQGYWTDDALTAWADRQPYRVWLVQERADTPLFWCFGDNLNWQVSRVDRPGELPPPSPAHLVSVVTGDRREPTPELHADLTRLGWRPDLRTRFFTLYVPR